MSAPSEITSFYLDMPVYKDYLDACVFVELEIVALFLRTIDRILKRVLFILQHR